MTCTPKLNSIPTLSTYDGHRIKLNNTRQCAFQIRCIDFWENSFYTSPIIRLDHSLDNWTAPWIKSLWMRVYYIHFRKVSLLLVLFVDEGPYRVHLSRCWQIASRKSDWSMIANEAMMAMPCFTSKSTVCQM